MADSTHAQHDYVEAPEWGTMPLDLYMTEHWDPKLSQDDQRLQLAHNFTALGRAGRLAYWEKLKDSHAPSQEQILDILLPLRPPVLRAVAERIQREAPDFVWLRTDYNNEDQHQAFLREDLEQLDSAENLLGQGIVLADKRFYDLGHKWQPILDCLPEIVDLEPEGDQQFLSDEDLQKAYAILEQAGHAFDAETAPEEYAEVTSQAHIQCCSRLLFVEDTNAFGDEEVTLNAIWLDDLGAVIRKTRSSAQMGCLYLTDATGGSVSCENSDFTLAEIGPDYLPGAFRRPPIRSR